MSKVEKFLPPIPEGMRIYEGGIEVAGARYRRENAYAFANEKEKRLVLEREPDNVHDSNAIRIIGIGKRRFSERKHFLGYVPAEIANKLVTSKCFEKVEARIRKIYIGDTGFVEIGFDLVGPNGDFNRYMGDVKFVEKSESEELIRKEYDEIMEKFDL